jgi:tetratricopeptide (TPR) repeat protein
MLRLWWELATFPIAKQDRQTTVRSPLPILLSLAFSAIALNCVFSIDWSAQTAWIILEMFKRLLFLLAFLAGICLAGIRSFKQQELDDRPAPWLHAAVLVGLGLFLLHNLIDFSLFEPGPMFLFALLAGSALGLRLPDRAPSPHGRVGAGIVLALSIMGWLAAAEAGWVPITEAEELSQDADNRIRTAKDPDAPPQTLSDTGNLDRAEQEFVEAFGMVPINADYAFRAEQTEILRHGEANVMRQLIDKAQAADPSSIRYRLARAVLESSVGNLTAAASDYEQILQLDPNNLEIRLQFADLLDKQGRSVEARQQYEKTLALNDELAPDEIRRLSEDQINQIHKRLR